MTYGIAMASSSVANSPSDSPSLFRGSHFLSLRNGSALHTHPVARRVESPLAKELAKAKERLLEDKQRPDRADEEGKEFNSETASEPLSETNTGAGPASPIQRQFGR